MKKADRAGKCRSRGKYGACSRQPGHPPGHAVYIGDQVWFVYGRPDKVVGYGRLDGETFTPLPGGLHGKPA